MLYFKIKIKVFYKQTAFKKKIPIFNISCLKTSGLCLKDFSGYLPNFKLNNLHQALLTRICLLAFVQLF